MASHAHERSSSWCEAGLVRFNDADMAETLSQLFLKLQSSDGEHIIEDDEDGDGSENAPLIGTPQQSLGRMGKSS